MNEQLSAAETSRTSTMSHRILVVEDEAVLLGHTNEFGIDVVLVNTLLNKPADRFLIGRFP